VVADIILKISNTDNPEWRYRAGTDADKLFDSRSKMSDGEFEKTLSELLNR
jgi:hypothetical protein